MRGFYETDVKVNLTVEDIFNAINSDPEKPIPLTPKYPSGFACSIIWAFVRGLKKTKPAWRITANGGIARCG